MNPRFAATRAVGALLRQEGSLASILPPLMEQVAVRDRPLLQEICFGTARWYPRLEAIIECLLQKPLRAKDLDVQATIACGLYQLEYMNAPAHAVINESVTAAGKLGKPWARGLVNAILRNMERRREEIFETLASHPQFLSAHPPWLLDMLQRAWPDQWQAIVAGNNERPPMCLRVNSQRSDRTAALLQLANAGFEAIAARWSGDGIYLARPTDVKDLPGFGEGCLSVQDEAAQLAAGLLDPQPGERILDACSAPGGKTCHLLELQPGMDELVALDVDEKRLERVRQNLDRLGLEATLLCAAAQEPDSWWDGQLLDRILLDAPCSATGVIRRHPDIKLLRRAEDIASLSALQSQLLQNLWGTLKPGGTLLYATCSVLPAENDDVVGRFVNHREDVESLPITASWGLQTRYGRQLHPTSDSHDGFYYALLRKSHQGAAIFGHPP